MSKYAVTTQDALDEHSINLDQLKTVLGFPVYLTTLPFPDEGDEDGNEINFMIIDSSKYVVEQVKGLSIEVEYPDINTFSYKLFSTEVQV